MDPTIVVPVVSAVVTEFINPLIAALAPVIIAWVLAKIAEFKEKRANVQLINLDIDAKQREFMDKLVQHAIEFAVFKTKSNDLTPEFLEYAVNYVQNKAPDLIAHFKLTPEKVAEIIVTRAQHRNDIFTGVENEKEPEEQPVLTLPNLEIKNSTT